MLKPVSILALDDDASSIAEAVRARIAAAMRLEDLVQARAIADDIDLAATIESIHAGRQSPDSPLRLRDDVANRELVLLMVSAAGSGGTRVLELAQRVRQLYEMRGMAQYFSIEVLCLMPDLFASSTAAEYGAAYSLLKRASAAMQEEPRPFDAMWLLASTNAARVKFGALAQTDAYAEVVVGALMFEPELSGTLPGAFRPRGMDATFSSFGYAELRFPRELVLQRLESRLASELIRDRLLTQDSSSATLSHIAAKQFVLGDSFSGPLSRIGVDGGQSLFRRFQPRAHVQETTRDAEEVIAAARSELQAYRNGTHVENLRTLTAQGDQTAGDFAQLLSRSVDEALDRDGYSSSARLLEALLDPLPEVQSEVASRNLITEIQTATAALDDRVRFTPNTARSETMRKRIRDIGTLLREQTLVAETLVPFDAGEETKARAEESAQQRAESLAAMQQEQRELALNFPDVLFAEETENNTARNAARDAEAARLLEETAAREQHLRDCFAELPRAERTLSELLEERVAYIRKQFAWGFVYAAAVYGVPLIFGRLLEVPLFDALSLWFVANFSRVTYAVLIALAAFAIYSVIRYLRTIGPRLHAAREHLRLLREQIEVADKAKSAAYNDELQFEYDVHQRRTALSVLRRTRDAARQTLDAVRTRMRELDALADSFAARSQTASIAVAAGVSLSIVDDADADAWYTRTSGDRKLMFLEFFEICVTRSQSLRVPLAELQSRVEAYAARGFVDLARLTLAQVANGAQGLVAPAAVAQRLRRLVESSAPLVEVRDDDIPAQQAMQRDTTLWIDASDAAFVELVRRRLPDAQLKPPPDPLRVHALSRVLHFPAYVLSQIEYYRAQYDAAQHPESAELPDLLPGELALTGAMRTAYEQILLGRAVGILDLREDGGVGRASSDAILGDSQLVAAQRLASTLALREELERELAPRLSVAEEVERGLHDLLESEPPLSALDRGVVRALLKRYGI